MTIQVDFSTLFDALSYPAFVVSTAGTIEQANRAAVAQFGDRLERRSLFDLEVDDRDAIERFLRRSASSRQGTIGKVNLRAADGAVRALRCTGCLLRAAAEAGPALLFITAVLDPLRFAGLANRVRDLNTEMRNRNRIQAVLQEGLREREALLGELQHRVRNNMQIISSILSMARSEVASPEAKSALADAAARVGAISAVQRVIYSLGQSNAIPAADFARELCVSLEQGILAGRRILLLADPINLSNDMAPPLALILNELLIITAKNAGPGRPQQPIEVELKQTSDEEVSLSVRDDGSDWPIPETGKRSSGLGLVRSLAQQMGGTFEVENADGERCVLRWPQRRESEAMS